MLTVTVRGGICGTATVIWVDVGEPMMAAAAVSPNRTVGSSPANGMKLLPDKVTVAPGGPSCGVNWFADAAKAGGGGSVNMSELVADPPAVVTVIGTEPGLICG